MRPGVSTNPSRAPGPAASLPAGANGPAGGNDKGYFKLWPADATALALAFDPDEKPDLADEHAVEIYMGVNPNGPQTVPSDQAALQADMDKVLRTLHALYKPSDAQSSVADKKAFRNYYVRLYSLGQLGLEGKDVATPVANDALKRLTADLIDDHAGRIKNGHLRELGKKACQLAGCFLLAFALLRLAPDKWTGYLRWLDLDPMVLSNFMLLWAGCFLGVWLSYGVRKSSFTLQDLTVSDSDRLTPLVRLIFAGFLTMLIGLLFVLGLVEVKIGAYPITDIGSRAMLAITIGIFCGLSELVLPTTLAKRASDFIGKVA